MDERRVRTAIEDQRKYARRAAGRAEGLDNELEEDRITLNELVDEMKKPQVSAPELELHGPGGMKLRLQGVGGWYVVTVLVVLAIAGTVIALILWG